MEYDTTLHLGYHLSQRVRLILTGSQDRDHWGHKSTRYESTVWWWHYHLPCFHSGSEQMKTDQGHDRRVKSPNAEHMRGVDGDG